MATKLDAPRAGEEHQAARPPPYYMRFGPKITAFLAAVRVMPNVTRAARAAGINKSQHYAKLQSSLDYRAAFDACMAIGCDAMSDVAVERAQIGWEEPIVYQGGFSYPLVWDDVQCKLIPDTSQPPLTIRKIDNNLLQFVLKNRHPDYREKKEVEAPRETAEKVIYQWVPRSKTATDETPLSEGSNTSLSTPRLDSTTAPAVSRDSLVP